MSKWLLAARKRMGGIFPREHAKQEMEEYARKMRERKARAGKKKRADSDDDDDPSIHWRVDLTQASRALAIKWIWKARDLRNGNSCKKEWMHGCDWLQHWRKCQRYSINRKG